MSLGKRTQVKLFLDKQGARISSGILQKNTHYSKGRKKRKEYIYISGSYLRYWNNYKFLGCYDKEWELMCPTVSMK